MVSNRVLDVVVRDAATRYCAACLAGAADISHEDAEAVIRAVAQHDSLQVLFGECDLCGQKRLVIRRRKAPTLFGN